MIRSRNTNGDKSCRDIPSFIEPRPPLITNPFMRPRPQKGTNLLDLFEDSENEESELVQVYLRLKPCNVRNNLYEVRSDRCLITSLDTTTAGHGRRTQHNVSKMYTFSHIFGPDSSQKEIFEHVVKDNLKRLPDGDSFTLLTYGASGSGKTFTLMGTVGAPGLVPRSLEYVFKVVEAAQQPVFKPDEHGAYRLDNTEQDYEIQWVKRLRQISASQREKYRRMSVGLGGELSHSNMDLSNRRRHYVWVSFIEIYNEGIYDLLAPGERRNASKLAIREDSSGNVYVKGASQAFVRTSEEAYDVMVAGKHNLQIAATGIHAQSSRSHCIFTITMLTETEGGTRSACVRLCDLAGCERAARTRNTGARLDESRAINSSLHVLERCLRMLRSKRGASTIVPYRESKLTRLLGAGLSGTRGEAVSMVVTLNPTPEYANETKHVLQLAAVAKDIQINNTVSDYPSSLESSTQDTTVGYNTTEVLKLRTDNERLHFELLQAESRNQELQASIEEDRAASGDVMRQLVEEAKDAVTKYYETKIAGMQAEVNQLVTDIAILEEDLSAEKLARKRAEEEVQHLRACIDERDEKRSYQDVIALSDSDDSDIEDDPCNDSLDVTLNKESLNRSKIIRQSILVDFNRTYNNSRIETKSLDSVKDLDETDSETENEDINNQSYITGNDLSGTDSKINKSDSKKCNSDDRTHSDNHVIENKSPGSSKIHKETDNEINSENINDRSYSKNLSGTSDKLNNLDTKRCNIDKTSPRKETSKVQTNLQRGTYFVNELDDINKTVETDIFSEKDTKLSHIVEPKILTDTFVGKILGPMNKSLESNCSIVQFERLEQEIKSVTNNEKIMPEYFSKIKLGKEKKNYFDNFQNHTTITAAVIEAKDKNIYFDNVNRNENHKEDSYNATSNKANEQKILLENCDPISRNGYLPNNELLKKTDDDRSPSIVKDEKKVFEPNTTKKLLVDNVTALAEKVSSVKKIRISTTVHDSLDIFDDLDSPCISKQVKKDVVIENAYTDNSAIKSDKIDHTFLQLGTKLEHVKISIPKNTEPIETMSDERNKQAGPIKHQKETEISENLATENSNENKVDVVVPIEIFTNDESQIQTNCTNGNNTTVEFENLYKEVTLPRATEFDLLLSQKIEESSVHENQSKNNTDNSDNDVKYNLRQRSKLDKPKTERKRCKNKVLEGDILLESLSKCASSSKPTRKNLRLRRQIKVSENNGDNEIKLKDIVNLQAEFSDVTIDVPVEIKPVKDIPSPEKKEDQENSPVLGIKSCPAKSVIRSRRKLFTPRAEPLEESFGHTGESGERVRVLRPSYHRPRARRKL